MNRWFRGAALVLVAGLTLFADAQDLAPVRHEPNGLNSRKAQQAHYVVLVSFDGFRYDYAEKYGATHLQHIAEEGATAPEGMLPSYPSLTFPNHYTLVTGLYPEHTGIVDNNFLDPAHGYRAYAYTDKVASNDGSWYSGVPLWSLAEKQHMRSAAMYWVGSESKIAGKRPSYWVPFDDKFDDAKRVDQVIAWLKLPEKERPHLITLYFSNVDHAGHDHTPDSQEVQDAVLHLDAIAGQLDQKLKATGLPVDLIIVSDHGMIQYKERKWITLDEFANLGDAKTDASKIYPATEAEKQRIYEELSASLKKMPEPLFEIYRRKDVPGYLHYNENPREGDPVAIWTTPQVMHARKGTAVPKSYADHGFDVHHIPQMKAIFYAEGPDIKAGVKLPSFENVNVYDFICGILNLKPAKNDGNTATLQPARNQ